MKIMKIKLNTLNDANSLVKAIDKYDYDIDAECLNGKLRNNIWNTNTD